MNHLYKNINSIITLSTKVNSKHKCAHTNTLDMLTRETLDQRENLGGNDAHKIMY